MDDLGQSPPVMRLPAEVLCLVLAHLDPLSLQQAGKVCRTWRRIVSDDRSWRLAFQRTFTRLPFGRLTPSRMPGTGSGSSAGGQWVDTTHRRSSWRQELSDRLRLRRGWQTTLRLGFGVRASTIDQLVVCEKHGWALAVSCAGAVAVKCHARTGKVLARDVETKDLVLALGAEPQTRVTALAARIDRILWGLADGRSVATHLTPGGALRSRVVAEAEGAPVLAVACPLDALAQRQPEWPAVYGVSADAVAASAAADGCVRVWSTDSGRLERILRSPRAEPLVGVTWSDGSRYVVAATNSAALVWDLHAPDDAPAFVHVIPGPASGLVLLAGDPFSDSFVVATEASGVYRMSVSLGVATTFVPDQPGFALVTAARWQADSPAPSQRQQRSPEPSTRLLLVGDARGSLWAFDADCPLPAARPLVAWPRLHRCAVASVAANAAVVVSGARDGQVLVLDPLTTRTLCAMRCRGSRNQRHDPWFWSVHPAIISDHTWNSVHLAQLLAARSSAQWDLQIQDRRDVLDRVPAAAAANNNNGDDVARLFAAEQQPSQLAAGFPSLVSDVHAGYGWVVVANGTRIQSCFVEPPGSTLHRPHKKKAPHRHHHHSLEREVEEDLASMRLETQEDRHRRIEQHARRTHLERTFIEPEEQLGLGPSEQLEYAIWLSSQQHVSSSEEMTEDEQLQYALLLSQTQT
ncbi:hypothetical protein GGI20_005463 [Coemansia sp. BCRC 34301]|nr:hypothetical protein GGI20_005463 [Coemansia sp. BCRC 34301]